MSISFARLKRYKNELLAGTLLLLAFTSSVWVFQSNKALAEQWEIRRAKEDEVDKLVDLSIQYPDYRDLLSRLGVVQWSLGNDEAAKNALDRAKYLDPNNPLAEELEKKLP